MTTLPPSDEIAAIKNRLAEIEDERQGLQLKLKELEAAELTRDARVPKTTTASATSATLSITNNSPAAEKVALFRRMFGGRTDVFPIRWENPKSGRSGYAPACSNEWVRGVCGKPQVKCGDCPNRAFIPVTSDMIECHLRGEDRVRPNGRGDRKSTRLNSSHT